jgi:hypothetical protein
MHASQPAEDCVREVMLQLLLADSLTTAVANQQLSAHRDHGSLRA